MPLSVVISSYNDGPLLAQCIRPLLSDPATTEVVVVIDGSTDGSYEAMRAWADTEPRLRPFLIENRGRAGARQFGIERATGDVVLLLDSDVIASGPLVSGHARWHADGTPRLVVGYMPIPAPPRAPGSFVVEHYARLYELRCQAYERNPQSIFDGLWGGNISLPRRAIEAAGGFDGGLGVSYSEDTEFGFRLADTGLEPVFDRGLRAEHRYRRSVAGFLAAGRQYGEAIVALDARHPGRVMFPPPPRSALEARLRALVARPLVHRLVLAVGRAAVAAAGRTRAWGLEARVGRLLERIEIEVGMRRARSAGQPGAAPAAEAVGERVGFGRAP